MRSLLGVLGLGAALAALEPDTARADCAAFDAEVKRAVAANDLPAFPTLLQRGVGEFDCPQDYRTRLGRVLALYSIRFLGARTRASGREPTLLELKAAAALAQPWQVMVPLGDAHYDRGDWVQAFHAYETALDDMRNLETNPTAPPGDDEKHAYRRAIQARALAPTFVASRSVRGAPAGLASPRFRNFTAVAVPVPVKFEYNQSKLTAEGEAAAKQIIAFLQSQGAKGVEIIGHTDPVGGEAFNQKLSEERAAAVAAYLKAHGYAGTVKSAGKGKREPFQPDDPGKYTPDQRHAFDRRVEYRLTP